MPATLFAPALGLSLAAAFAILPAIQSAEAADGRGRYALHGIGNDSCKNWIEARREEGVKVVAMEAWLLGFVSAFNAYGHDGQDIADEIGSDDMFEWLDGYCADHRKEKLGHAATGLVQALRLRHRNQ